MGFSALFTLVTGGIHIHPSELNKIKFHLIFRRDQIVFWRIIIELRKYILRIDFFNIIFLYHTVGLNAVYFAVHLTFHFALHLHNGVLVDIDFRIVMEARYISHFHLFSLGQV